MICLARKQSLTASYEARILGPDLPVRHTVKPAASGAGRASAPTAAAAPRPRSSAATSYTKPGQFSTRTTLCDMRRGKRISDLECFSFTAAAAASTRVNLWGVTFDARDSDHFYATLATGGKTHLVEGSVRGRRARVIHDNVECPSLSPDGTRIGFKKLVGKDPAVGRFHVLDLKTPARLARRRQPALPLRRAGVWTVRADGTGATREYLAAADSPAVVR